jgi:uncharacterized protein YjcR
MATSASGGGERRGNNGGDEPWKNKGASELIRDVKLTIDERPEVIEAVWEYLKKKLITDKEEQVKVSYRLLFFVD